MKKSIITAMLALVAMAGWAQDICGVKATADDYIKLLNEQGLYVYALDLSKLEKYKYLMAPVIQVYTNGKLEEDILSDWGILYKSTPFAIQPNWKEYEVIPVVAYSSYWYDSDDKICRNCDEREFGADYMNGNTFKHSPHIYVFGIKIWKR